MFIKLDWCKYQATINVNAGCESQRIVIKALKWNLLFPPKGCLHVLINICIVETRESTGYLSIPQKMLLQHE